MWVRTKRGYLSLVNGTYLTVKEARRGGEWRVVVMATDNTTVLYLVQDGYLTEEDAQSSLEDMMNGVDSILTIREPAIEEEE